MEGKDSFIFYISWFRFFNKLKTIEQREKLRVVLEEYVTDKYKDIPIEEITTGDDVVDMAFASIVEDLKKDLGKWKTTCSKRAEAGKLGGLAKAKNNKQNLANVANAKNAKEEIANLANVADSDNDYDNEYENDNDISNDINYSNYSIDSPKIEKNQSKNPSYNLIFDTWNSEKPLIHHQELTPIREKAIDKALKNFQTAQIVDAIKHYAMVLRSQYKFTYKWDLETFLKQENAMPRFTDEGGIWNSFLEAVNENPLILALEDRTEDVPTETPGVLKNFMNQIK